MIKAGDVVRVNIPQGEQTAISVMKFNGLVTRVKRKVPIRFSANRAVYIDNYYELNSMTSPKGIPYAFIEDWLERV